MSARQHIFFQGRVQGVGFRFTARSLAKDFTVTGFVRNLPNGEVELVAEGAAAELEGFLGALREEMSHNITSERVGQSVATNEFSAFEIRY
ncbi:MAG: acylphosphatase [Pirellulales bacterium]|nr:acylphosphatase [Pirellulales bacterium]